jgi:pilus assembly protein FimV
MLPVEISRRQAAIHYPLGPYLALYLAALALAWAAASVQALGLGDISAQSALGRPLRVVVPIIAELNDALSGDCFKLAPTGRDGDGVPELQTGRVTLERVGGRAELVVSTTRAVNDPLLRLTVQAGCDNSIRREYVLLLDPLSIEAPLVANDGAPPRTDAAAANAADAGVRANAGTRGDATGTGAKAHGRGAKRSRVPITRTAASGAHHPQAHAAPAKRATVAPKASAKSARSAPSATASPLPRLTVSTVAPAAVAGGKGVAETRQPSPQESANALEAETLMLRQRVAQLSELVDRLQSEMRAAQAIEAARLAAEEAAKSTPQAILGRWWNGGWPIFAAVFGLAALVAVGLGWKRRRSAPGSTVWANVIGLPETPAPPLAASTAGVASPAPRADSSPSDAPSREPEADSAPAAVSELSHVTEEAGVYLAFNRVDRAIEVLREHIRAQPRSLPAAWLMLLDVYRSNGRELEFRQLAAEFQQHFNAQAPKWRPIGSTNKTAVSKPIRG